MFGLLTMALKRSLPFCTRRTADWAPKIIEKLVEQTYLRHDFFDDIVQDDLAGGQQLETNPPEGNGPPSPSTGEAKS